MGKLVTVAQMRAIEAAADAAGVSYAEMMNNAGRALADRILALADEPGRIMVLVGPGNNGGDALVAANLIAAESAHEVSCYLYKARDEDDPHFAAVQEAGLFVAIAAQDQQFRVLRNLINSSQIIVDGLLGIGLHLPVEGDLAKLMDTTRRAILSARQARPTATYQTPADPAVVLPVTPYVIAVDCPSGLDSDTGELDTATIPADETMTFIAAKTGQVTFPGASAVGTLHVAGIGLPKSLPARDDVALELLTATEARALLPDQPLNAHKGTFGKAMLVAGSLNYMGAAGLAAEAAYRVGAGLVTVGAPQPIIPVLAASLPEATWLLLPHDMGVVSEGAAKVLKEELDGYSALLMGPGWGREDTTRDFLAAILGNEQEQQARRQIGFAPSSAAEDEAEAATANDLPPLVIDADGLNLLSEIEDWPALLPANTILTPHPGEMARLTGLERDDVQAQRIKLAQEKAAAWQAIVVLKGAFTVIAAPDGRTTVLPFAEPALATAGTGDVLAGAITGLLAQGVEPFAAAALGGYLHGLAGVYAAQAIGTARSVKAHDVLDVLPEAMWTVEQAG